MASTAPPVSTVRDLLRALAVPRLHGSPGAAAVEERVRAEFDRIGIPVRELPFEFSVLPGRYGVRMLGVLLAATLPAAAMFALAGRLVAAGCLIAADLLVGILAVTFSDAALLRLPFGRVTGMNLLASPGDGAPRFLVVAHRDSKSQPLPLILRVGGAVSCVIATVTLLVALAAGGASSVILAGAGVLGGIGGLLIACCGIGNGSDGALDNASGVAGLLRIAETEVERGSGDVAFLITDAEEYGLAGARALAGAWSGLEAVINLDGLDDVGPIVLIEGRSPFAAPPTRITWAIDQCAALRDVQLRHRGLPPGLLLDHVPFSRAGLHAFTVMRGTLRSLARVHRPADSIDRIDGTGVSLVAGIVAESLDVIRRGDDRRAGRVARNGEPG